jgi:hypothetical protein
VVAARAVEAGRGGGVKLGHREAGTGTHWEGRNKEEEQVEEGTQGRKSSLQGITAEGIAFTNTRQLLFSVYLFIYFLIHACNAIFSLFIYLLFSHTRLQCYFLFIYLLFSHTRLQCYFLTFPSETKHLQETPLFMQEPTQLSLD